MTKKDRIKELVDYLEAAKPGRFNRVPSYILDLKLKKFIRLRIGIERDVDGQIYPNEEIAYLLDTSPKRIGYLDTKALLGLQEAAKQVKEEIDNADSHDGTLRLESVKREY